MSYAPHISHLLDGADDQVRVKELEDVRNLHPSDIAEALEESDADPSQLVEILYLIGNHKAVESFAQLSIETQQECLEAANAQTMLRFVENMEPDDRVDLLKAVDDDVREAIMPLIAQAERNAEAQS